MQMPIIAAIVTLSMVSSIGSALDLPRAASERDSVKICFVGDVPYRCADLEDKEVASALNRDVEIAEADAVKKIMFFVAGILITATTGLDIVESKAFKALPQVLRFPAQLSIFAPAFFAMFKVIQSSSKLDSEVRRAYYRRIDLHRCLEKYATNQDLVNIHRYHEKNYIVKEKLPELHEAIGTLLYDNIEKSTRKSAKENGVPLFCLMGTTY